MVVSYCINGTIYKNELMLNFIYDELIRLNRKNILVLFSNYKNEIFDNKNNVNISYHSIDEISTDDCNKFDSIILINIEKDKFLNIYLQNSNNNKLIITINKINEFDNDIEIKIYNIEKILCNI